MVKRGTIGKIQLIIGVVLLISSLVSMVYVKENHRNELGLNVGNFVEEIKNFQTENFTSDEIKLITVADSSQRYIIEDKYLKLNFIILESLLSVIFIISLLFITQGLVNMSEKQRW